MRKELKRIHTTRTSAFNPYTIMIIYFMFIYSDMFQKTNFSRIRIIPLNIFRFPHYFTELLNLSKLNFYHSLRIKFFFFLFNSFSYYFGV